MRFLFFVIFMVLVVKNTYGEIRHANKHVHGLNHVQITLNGKQLAIRYQMPIVQLSRNGDEHKHDKHDEHEPDKHDKHDEHKHDKHDEHEHDKHDGDDRQLESFLDYSKMFQLGQSANCVLTNYEGEIEVVSMNADENSDTGHKDVILTYKFSCEQPNVLDKIKFNSFSQFDELQHVEVEALINKKAIAVELGKGNPTLTW